MVIKNNINYFIKVSANKRTSFFVPFLHRFYNTAVIDLTHGFYHITIAGKAK